jgi:hypothetical protein
MRDHRTTRRAPAAAVSCLTITALIAGAVQWATAEPAGQSERSAPTRADRLAEQLVKTRVRLDRAERRVRALERVVRHEPTVAEALTIASVVYGVPRTDLSTVAFCESGHRPSAVNGQYRGIFQWGPSWNSTVYAAAGLSPWSPYAAALATAQRVKGAGWGWWSCKP